MVDIGKKLWGFCHTLRHEGISYTRYIEQITCLLFIKMAAERDIVDLSRIKYEELGEKRMLDCSWRALASQSGTELLEHYEATLRALGKQPGILGDIFAGAQSRFKTPVSLKKLLGLIDETEWTSLEVDVKGKVYEDLLEQAASEGKKGAGQMFTPRLVIQSIVRCVQPDPRAHKEFKICDPACGTGGFLVCAYEWFLDQTGGGAIPRDLAKRLRAGTYFGQDIDDEPRRFALMNLYLHGIEPQIKLGDTIYEAPETLNTIDVVLTNPPFGTRGANQAPEREDFIVATSNKQLNFIQHVMSMLRPGGRAAVVVPDNCLFADQAGAVFDDLNRADLLKELGELGLACHLPECPRRLENQPAGATDPQRTELLRTLDQQIAELDQRLAEAESIRSDAQDALDEGTKDWRRELDGCRRRESELERDLVRYRDQIGKATELEHLGEELTQKGQRLEKQSAKADASLEQQREMRKQHAQRHATLNRHADHVAKSLLGPDAGAEIVIEARAFRPVATTATAAGGDAIGTSALVLGLDLACLRASCEGLGLLPRLLIHDSPREADLERQIYDHLFEIAVHMEQSCAGDPNFQYIVTTTSTPPDVVRDDVHVRLTLDGQDDEDLFLRRRV